jgi:hypothetical protein
MSIRETGDGGIWFQGADTRQSDVISLELKCPLKAFSQCPITWTHMEDHVLMQDKELTRSGWQRNRRWPRGHLFDGDRSSLCIGEKPSLENALVRLEPC